MSIEVSVVSVVTFFLLALSLAVFFQKQRDQLTRSYSFFVLTVALWGLGISGFFLVQDKVSLELWARYLYAFGASTAPAFLYFTLTFPVKADATPVISTKKKVFIIVPSLIIFALIFFTNLLIAGAFISENGQKGFFYGPLSHLIDIHVWGFYLLALIVFVRKLLASSGIQRSQLLYANAGTYLSLSVINITNIILPSFFHEFRFLWIGPSATIILVVMLAYAITKHHLFNIKVAVTEILTALLGAVLFINMLMSESIAQRAWRASLFISVVILGYFLVRQVLRELTQKEQLQQVNIQLKKLDASKSEFVSIASHQLRTPLTAIKGYISMLMEGSYGELGAKQKKPMENVYNSNERLIRLVNDLLNISRIESGKIVMEWQKANMEDVIQGVIEELQIKSKEKRLKIVFEKPEPSLPLFNMDPGKVRNVLLNLLDNAIKYTRKGSITIALYAKPDSTPRSMTSALITVKDTGQGMDANEISHLFESFSRGSAGNTMWTEGSGLGLYIAKQFVLMHKGKIWAESDGTGKGSTFYVELPVS